MPVAALIGSALNAVKGAAPKKKKGEEYSLLDRLFATQAAVGFIEQASRAIWDHVPQFQHGVSVTVKGGPNADIRRVWYLTCSLAFGRLRRSPKVAGGQATMDALWDISGKLCKLEVVYRAAKLAYSEDIKRPSESLPAFFGAAGALTSMIAGVPDKPPKGADSTKDHPLIFVQQGPDQLTIGGSWPGFLLRPSQATAVRATVPVFVAQKALIAGLFPITRAQVSDRFPRNVLREYPIGSSNSYRFNATFYPLRFSGAAIAPGLCGTPVNSRTAPTLPDDGRIITTAEKNDPKVQPPRPWIDGATRVSLLALVSNAISDPGFLPEAPPVTQVPLVSNGRFVYTSGLKIDDKALGDRVNAIRPAVTIPPTPEARADGYPALPGAIADVRKLP